jgi:hypothetical protein
VFKGPLNELGRGLTYHRFKAQRYPNSSKFKGAPNIFWHDTPYFLITVPSIKIIPEFTVSMQKKGSVFHNQGHTITH